MDFVILGILLVLSFVPLGVFTYQESQKSSVTLRAEISVDGKEIKRLNLDKDTTYKYQASDGDYNVIVVKDHKIRITEANCNDQICVRRGWIEKSGESIVCLPHKLVVSIVSSDGSEDGSLIY